MGNLYVWCGCMLMLVLLCVVLLLLGCGGGDGLIVVNSIVVDLNIMQLVLLVVVNWIMLGMCVILV